MSKKPSDSETMSEKQGDKQQKGSKDWEKQQQQHHRQGEPLGQKRDRSIPEEEADRSVRRGAEIYQR